MKKLTKKQKTRVQKLVKAAEMLQYDYDTRSCNFSCVAIRRAFENSCEEYVESREYESFTTNDHRFDSYLSKSKELLVIPEYSFLQHFSDLEQRQLARQLAVLFYMEATKYD